MKPQLAENWDETKITFPKMMQPKLDGVRGLHITGEFTGRSLKKFKNKNLTSYYSHPKYAGFDGELVLSGGWSQERLCSLTTGLVNRVNDPALPEWVVFDLINDDTKHLPYQRRYEMLLREVEDCDPLVTVMPSIMVFGMDQVLAQDEQWLEWGYEGSILRAPDELLKEGRTDKRQQLWRIKRFIDVEARCIGIYEAQENQNEAKTNELGRTERSTHKANKVGKGMLGGLDIRFEEDIFHNGKLLFPKGLESKCGPGEMTHAERELYFEQPELIVGQIIKEKTFPQGVKDKPRMGTFISIRSPEDMS